MINAKVFISHSAKSEDVARHLDAISSALTAAGWEVRLDKTGLDVGDGWRSKLFQWMDEVHAAVLLLSRSALESKFVPIELSVLSFRHMREQNFPLLPVLIDDVDVKALGDGMIGELRLAEIQSLPAKEPAETAKRVAERLGEQYASSGRLRTPLEMLEQTVVTLLKNAGFNEEQLVEAAYVTDQFVISDTAQPGNVFMHFASSLLRVDFETACNALLALGERRTSSDARCCLLELLDIVAPFWVSESEAAKLARYAMAGYEHRGFLLVCREPWTARIHICRSSMKPIGTGWLVCELPPPECEDQLMWIWRQLAIALTPAASATRKMGVEDVRRRLQRLEQRRQPLFLLFPPEWTPSVHLLSQLRQTLPTLTFFVTGSSEDLEDLRSHALELLSKGEDCEMDALETYDLTQLRLMPSRMPARSGV